MITKQQKTCALYLRISTRDKNQSTENQREPLKHLADSLGLSVVKIYEDKASGGSADRQQFREMMEAARRHAFDSILIWSLDRFSREGISNTLGYLEQLKKSNVALKSLQESWLDTSDAGVGQLLLAVMSWVAKQERERMAERIKAGLIRTKKNGTTLGRPRGSADKKRRVKSGYFMRWERERSRSPILA